MQLQVFSKHCCMVRCGSNGQTHHNWLHWWDWFCCVKIWPLGLLCLFGGMKQLVVITHQELFIQHLLCWFVVMCLDECFSWRSWHPPWARACHTHPKMHCLQSCDNLCQCLIWKEAKPSKPPLLFVIEFFKRHCPKCLSFVCVSGSKKLQVHLGPHHKAILVDLPCVWAAFNCFPNPHEMCLMIANNSSQKSAFVSNKFVLGQNVQLQHFTKSMACACHK